MAATAPAPLHPRSAAARAFVRSFNILVKQVRLYGSNYQRLGAQFEATWKQLREAAAERGFLLRAAGPKLLMDGVALEMGTAERALAQTLSASLIGGLQFQPAVSLQAFTEFVVVFSLSRPDALLEELKKKLQCTATIRVHGLQLSTEEGAATVPLAAQLAASALGNESAVLQACLDPAKLLQLIAASEATQGASRAGPLKEEDVVGAIRWLAHLASAAPGEAAQAALPSDASHFLQQVLTSVSETRPEHAQPLLVTVAEHVAIRFALEKYERGEIRTNAVREVMQRMAAELEALRRAAGVTTEPGESHAEMLDRQFWARVPERGKNLVLLSADAWCIPARNVRTYVEALSKRGERELAARVLENYSCSVQHADADARKTTAAGLAELADLYGRMGGDLLRAAMERVGAQMLREAGNDLLEALNRAMVRLTEEAARRRDYPALRHLFNTVEALAQHRPAVGQELQSRITVHERLPEFIAEAARAAVVSGELLEVLRRAPEKTADEVVTQFARCVRRQECERLVEISAQLGSAAVRHLGQVLRTRGAAQAVGTVGLLSRLDLATLQSALPQLLARCDRVQQDNAIRMLACADAPQRGVLLLSVLPLLDFLVAPQAVDEMGISGGAGVGRALQGMAQGEGDIPISPYLRLKAVEALGRLREPAATSLLLSILSARKLLSWQHPRELRMAAAQALLALDLRHSPAIMGAGFSVEELKLGALETSMQPEWARQRRYPRVSPMQVLTVSLSTLRGNASVAVERLSLGGGVGASISNAPLDYEAALEMPIGFHRLRCPVMIRPAAGRKVGFEIMDIDLEERFRLRRLLAQQPAE